LGKNEKGKQEEGRGGKDSAEICVICGESKKEKVIGKKWKRETGRRQKGKRLCGNLHNQRGK